MAIGDDATAAGYQLVPESGENGRVRWGARELNRGRDYTAQIRAAVIALQNLLGDKGSVRTRAGISAGTGNPSGGQDGDIYFKII